LAKDLVERSALRVESTLWRQRSSLCVESPEHRNLLMTLTEGDMWLFRGSLASRPSCLVGRTNSRLQTPKGGEDCADFSSFCAGFYLFNAACLRRLLWRVQLPPMLLTSASAAFRERSDGAEDAPSNMPRCARKASAEARPCSGEVPLLVVAAARNTTTPTTTKPVTPISNRLRCS
jgi:hypothetical protein